MTEEDYIELVIFIEAYQKRDKLDRTKFSDEVFEESKMRINNYQKKQRDEKSKKLQSLHCRHKREQGI